MDESILRQAAALLGMSPADLRQRLQGTASFPRPFRRVVEVTVPASMVGELARRSLEAVDERGGLSGRIALSSDGHLVKGVVRGVQFESRCEGGQWRVSMDAGRAFLTSATLGLMALGFVLVLGSGFPSAQGLIQAIVLFVLYAPVVVALAAGQAWWKLRAWERIYCSLVQPAVRDLVHRWSSSGP